YAYIYILVSAQEQEKGGDEGGEGGVAVPIGKNNNNNNNNNAGNTHIGNGLILDCIDDLALDNARTSFHYPNKNDLMPLLNFGAIISICLLSVTFNIIIKTVFMPDRNILEGVIVLHESKAYNKLKAIEENQFPGIWCCFINRVAKWQIICQPKEINSLGGDVFSGLVLLFYRGAGWFNCRGTAGSSGRREPKVVTIYAEG
ncbi:hypothetical protein ACJX0J_018522, partial [Zea mays]